MNWIECYIIGLYCWVFLLDVLDHQKIELHHFVTCCNCGSVHCCLWGEGSIPCLRQGDAQTAACTEVCCAQRRCPQPHAAVRDMLGRESWCQTQPETSRSAWVPGASTGAGRGCGLLSAPLPVCPDSGTLVVPAAGASWRALIFMIFYTASTTCAPALCCVPCKVMEIGGWTKADRKQQRLSVLEKSLNSLRRVFQIKLWLDTLHSFVYSCSPKITAPRYAW